MDIKPTDLTPDDILADESNPDEVFYTFIIDRRGRIYWSEANTHIGLIYEIPQLHHLEGEATDAWYMRQIKGGGISGHIKENTAYLWGKPSYSHVELLVEGFGVHAIRYHESALLHR